MKLLRNSLLGGLASLALLATPLQAQVLTAVPPVGLQPYSLPGPQVPAILPGHTVVGGPAPAAFTFTGQITITTTGSYTTGVLSVNQSTSASPITIPIGSVISGGTTTTGTTVVGQLQGSNNYQVVATGGTIAAVASGTLTATPKLSTIIQDTTFTTAPTYSSGGCSVGPPVFVAGSNVSSWTFTNGTGTCSGNVLVLTFPAAPVAWMCTAMDITNPNLNILVSTGTTSLTTQVTFTDYAGPASITPAPGTAQPWTANDVIVGQCTPR